MQGEAIRSCRAMVTSPHALATQAGVAILRNGGNAADAIVAVAAALAVLYPHMTGIGGDAFFLYYDAASGEMHGYNGSGRAAKQATLEFYSALGHSAIPQRGPHAALTVPGAVDTWFALLERFGTTSIDRILEPAIAYAREGAPAAGSFVRAVGVLRELLVRDEGASDLYVRRGPDRVGAVFRNPELADTLRAIAKEGRAWFYEGEGARAVSAHAARTGSPLRLDDLAKHSGMYCRPIAGRFLGFDSLTVPPNSQGLALLVAQQVYEAFAHDKALEEGSAAQVHAAIESMKLAIADRDELVTDPQVARNFECALSVAHAREKAASINPYSALGEKSSTIDGGDTTYFACVDSQGNAVSYIQSLFFHFGSGVVVPELGMALQNRGIAFELTKGRIRSLEPQRRPFHTLMPCMLAREGKPVLVYGSMGGEAQPQIGLQISTKIVVAGLDPASALAQPRWRWTKDVMEEPLRVHVESRMGDACIAGLRARGHDVNVLGEWEESMGHAGAILIDSHEGILSGASDPRSDGAAAGF
jgi:gamma-glutamyltranspeptidase